MSVINKMHQGLKENGENSPILSVMPDKKHKQKILLFCLISLLLISSLALSYLIYTNDNNISTEKIVIDIEPVGAEASVIVVTPTPIVSDATIKLENEVINVVTKVAIVTPSPVVKAIFSPEPITQVAKPDARKGAQLPKKEKKAYLSIQKSNLTKAELADIHLKISQKALIKGDSLLASQEQNKALNIKPDLHEVRKSLALYYYGTGEQNRASRLLKKGAIQYPEYSDFNLTPCATFKIRKVLKNA